MRNGRRRIRLCLVPLLCSVVATVAGQRRTLTGFPIDAPGIRALPASPFQGRVQVGETVGVVVSGEDAQTLVIVKRTAGDGIGGKVVSKANRASPFS